MTRRAAGEVPVVDAWRRGRPPRASLAWAARAIAPAARVATVRLLGGGGWLATHALEAVEPSGRRHDVVLRRWARPGWEVDDPLSTAANEAEVLRRLAAAAPALPVPRVLAVDRDGTETDVPAILMTRLPGRPPSRAARRREPVLRTLAEALVEIESIDAGLREVVPAYYGYYRVDELRPPPASGRPDRWRDAFRIAAGAPPAGPTTFIHRDYHPGNTLWTAGRLTGIVDWTAACWGPPGADVGHLLANLGVDQGPDVADAAARLYVAAGGEAGDLPWWRLRAFLDFVPDYAARADARLLRAVETYLEALLQQS